MNKVKPPIHPIIDLLTDSKKWSNKRDQNIEAGRKCRDVLTDPNSHWKYPPDDERVKEAVGKWVERARNCHAIAMGRRPVISKFVYVSEDNQIEGQLFTRKEDDNGKSR